MSNHGGMPQPSRCFAPARSKNSFCQLAIRVRADCEMRERDDDDGNVVCFYNENAKGVHTHSTLVRMQKDQIKCVYKKNKKETRIEETQRKIISYNLKNYSSDLR